MTIIAWDGKTLAADSLTSDKNTTQCYLSFKIQRLLNPIKIGTKTEAVITAICAAGNRSITVPIVKAIVSLKEGSISNFLNRRKQLGVVWPEWDNCQIGLVGTSNGEPYFAVIKNGGVYLAKGPTALGITNTPIDTFIGALDSAAAYVYTLMHLYPDACGGEIVRYDPVAKELNLVDTTVFNPEELKTKLVTAFTEYLSKVDDPSNLRYNDVDTNEVNENGAQDE